MKLSKIIEAIKEDIEIYGDVEARYYRYDHLHATSESWMYSPMRRNKKGDRLKMSAKELREYVEGRIDFKAHAKP
jgi:hypothetical protein